MCIRDRLSGQLFVFRNRNRDKLKILYWDRDGLAIWYKRLEQGTFQFPTDGKPMDQDPKEELAVGIEIAASDLSLLLGGIDLRSAKKRKRYTPPKKSEIVSCCLETSWPTRSLTRHGCQ